MATVKVNSPDNDNFVSQHIAGLRAYEDIYEAIEAGDSEITLDFSSVNWVEAPLLVPLACAVNGLRDQGFTVSVEEPVEERTSGYLDSIQFPDGYRRSPWGWPSTSYLPIFNLNPDTRTDSLEEVADKIRRLISRTSGVSNGQILNAISLPIGETIDNIDQHSEFDNASLMAQFYRTKDYVDICIADDGISIPGRFEEHGHDFTDDAEAIRLAVEEGWSTKEDEGRVDQRGKGLRTIHNLVCNGLDGELLVSARGCATHFTSDRARPFTQYSWKGTCVAARILPPGPEFDVASYVV